MHCKSYSHFLSKKFQHVCVSLEVNFNESLTNDIVSFEQLGPDLFPVLVTIFTVISTHVLISMLQNFYVIVLKSPVHSDIVTLRMLYKNFSMLDKNFSRRHFEIFYLFLTSKLFLFEKI